MSVENTWKVDKHIASTSYHKVKISRLNIHSWAKFYKYYTESDLLPPCCPGFKPDTSSAAQGIEYQKKVAHEIPNSGARVVGAHVRIKDKDGNIRFGIVPTCKVSRKSEAKHL